MSVVSCEYFILIKTLRIPQPEMLTDLSYQYQAKVSPTINSHLNRRPSNQTQPIGNKPHDFPPNACPYINAKLAFLTEKAALLWKIHLLQVKDSFDLCAISANGRLYKLIKGKKVQ